MFEKLIKFCSNRIICLGNSYFCIKLPSLLDTILGQKFEPTLEIAKTFHIASRLSISVLIKLSAVSLIVGCTSIIDSDDAALNLMPSVACAWDKVLFLSLNSGGRCLK